jgi:uncharacterized protein with von Willebrand factor type A (vWA) domain
MESAFTLKIETGNDAMRLPVDVADALRRLADEILAGNGEDGWHLNAGSIRDTNGNTVGSWDLTEPEHSFEVGW